MRRALRGLRYIERERICALVMLGVAAIIIACSVLLAVISPGQPTYLIPATIGVLGGLLLVVLAASAIVDARRRERLYLDRINE